MTKEIVFRGVDSSGDAGLWISDGTAANTVELTGVTGASATGLDPAHFLELGNVLLFAGVDAAGHAGLWETQGTAATTKEVAVTGASASEFDPTRMTLVGGEDFFSAVDAAGHRGLWVSDGTAAGTKEVTVAGASASGLDPTNGVGGSGTFAVVGKEAYFIGHDASGAYALWKSDGTTAGTTEVTGIAGAPTPTGIRALGTSIVFSGESGASSSLYVSDGTAAGTHELTGIVGARSDANGGIAATNMRHVGGKIFFGGIDSDNQKGLWMTDGTAAGTTEIKAFGASSPVAITALNKTSAVFAVQNASGDYDLYVTNGTAAGTTELTGIAGADAKGILSGASFPQLVYHNGEIYFAGLDANGDEMLWVTDGTAAGTKDLGPISGAGAKGIDPSHFANIGKPSTSSSSATTSHVAQLGSALFDAVLGGGGYESSHAAAASSSFKAAAQVTGNILGDVAPSHVAHG